MFSKKNTNTRRARDDRFLAPRSSMDELRTRQFLTNDLSCITPDLDRIHTPNFLYKKKYMEHLDNSFGLKSKKRDISTVLNYDNQENYSLQPWPCIPRKKRNLELTGSVLDLPTFSYAIFTDILDWGKKDILAAALGRVYYNWSWIDQNVVNKGFTSHSIHACKIEPTDGNVIAFGTCNGFELHDMGLCKWFLRRCKLCSGKLQHNQIFCQMTCLDWSPTGNAFALGCTCGIITAYTKDAVLINDVQVKKDSSVFKISISPDARYLAYFTVNSATVHILTWTDLQRYSAITFVSIIKTLNWHPWRSSLLCIGVNQKSHLILAFWNVAVERINFYTPSLEAPCHINCALFNDITGELVLSVVYIGTDVRLREETSLLVLSDPYTVVDMWDKPEASSYSDKIRKMMFSPDGTKLATATSGEDLMIWHFLRDSVKDKPKRLLKKFCTIPVYVDCANSGFSIR